MTSDMPCSPYLIFMKCDGRYSDTDLLGEFGVADYEPICAVPQHGPYTAFCTCGDWTLIADDGRYSLCSSPTTRIAICRLSEHMDIFAHTVGDCDNSFDFIYYRNGTRVREYVVVDPDFNSSIVKLDFGKPLPGENEAPALDDRFFGMLTIPRALGIPTPTLDSEYRIYSHLNSG